MGDGEEKVKGKQGERWRDGFGPPKNFGVAPPQPTGNWDLFLLQVGIDTENRPSFATLTTEFAKMAKDPGSGRHRKDMNRFLVQH